MFSTIYRFEVRQHLKKPFTWIFLLLMIAQGLYYMRHAGEYYAADQTFANAPAIVFITLAAVGYIGFIVTAILSGAALCKDLEYRTASFLYTSRASEKSFFWGRYAGSITILLLLNGGYLLGIILYSYAPIPNLGPLAVSTIGKALMFVFLPNIFVVYSLGFAAAVWMRNAKSAYIVAIFAMLLMIFGETSFSSNVNTVLVDPTGFSAVHALLDNLSPLEKNNFNPGFTGLLFYNRLIWMGIALLALLGAASKFSFLRFVEKNVPKKKGAEEEDGTALVVFQQANSLKKVSQCFSINLNLKKVFSLSWLAFKGITRPLGFKLFLGMLLIIYIGYIAIWQQQYYSVAPTLPVTIEITGVTLPLSFYFLLFIIINTTELLFKDQSSGFWQIGDALPIPTWTNIFSKVMAMIWVSLLLTTFLMLFGLLVQAAKGYYHFELGVYLNDLYIRWMPKYIVYILLTVFVAGATANRYATYWITLLVLIVSTVLHELEVVEQNRLNFVFSPGAGMNTDMNGNGIFAAAHLWYMAYWFCLTVALFSIGLWAWQRGTAAPFMQRITRIQKGNGVLIFFFIAGSIGFVSIGSKIYQTVNIENKFTAHADERLEQVNYEKTYKRYQNYPQPKITDLKLALDFYPSARRVEFTAALQLKNKSLKRIDTLHVEWMDFAQLSKVTMMGKQLTLLKNDEELRHRMYRLDTPLMPGDSLLANLSGNLHYDGFTNDDPQLALAFNGSFLSKDIVPYFGYDDRRELKANNYRAENALAKLKTRLPAVTDPYATNQSFASTQADQLHYELQLSTAKDQVVVAPGQLKSSSLQNGRKYFNFVSTKADHFNFYFLSAKYALQKEHALIKGTAVDIEAYYHPAHHYNVSDMIRSSKEALTFLQGLLGNYPYPNLKIAERPRYDEELHAFGNVIVLPENHGWIADIRKKEDLDYLRFVTTKLIAEQYLQQANISRTQGYPLLLQSIPGYLACKQLAKFYGAKSLAHYFKKNEDSYLKGRAKETNTEPSLLTVDEQATCVSVNKGSHALYKLSEVIGETPINKAIAAFLALSKTQVQAVNAHDFYRLLAKETPTAHQKQLAEIFNSK